MWISFPLKARAEVAGFDPSTTLVNRYTGRRGKGAVAAAVGGEKQE